MKKLSTRDLVILSLLLALLIVSGYVSLPTPSGLSIVWSMVPVAVGAVAFGPMGGMIMGMAFGIMSFLQCFGILGHSRQGMELLAMGVNPLLLLVQRFVPRLLDGVAIGFIHRLLRKKLSVPVCCAATGFLAAFLNTVLFMSALVLVLGHTEYMVNAMAGRAFFAYVVASVSVNSVIEMVVSTLLTASVGTALYKAGLIRDDK